MIYDRDGYDLPTERHTRPCTDIPPRHLMYPHRDLRSHQQPWGVGLLLLLLLLLSMPTTMVPSSSSSSSSYQLLHPNLSLRRRHLRRCCCCCCCCCCCYCCCCTDQEQEGGGQLVTPPSYTLYLVLLSQTRIQAKCFLRGLVVMEYLHSFHFTPKSTTINFLFFVFPEIATPTSRTEWFGTVLEATPLLLLCYSVFFFARARCPCCRSLSSSRREFMTVNE